MSMENPFASPLADSTPSARAVFEQGVWRDGTLLVISRGATLPNRCVRCNAPAAEKPMHVRLSWHSPMAYLGLLGGLLPYVIVALIMTKRLDVRIGVCRYHVQRRRRAMILATLLFMLGVGLMVVAFAGKEPSGLLFVAGIATILSALIGGIIGSRIVTPSRIERDMAWVKGACHEYMDHIPEFQG